MIPHLAELARYRELIRNLVARDLKVRYRDSVLGFVWCLLNPLLMTVVFTVVFTVLMKSDIPSFPVFVLIGLLAWNFHAAALTAGIGSIVGNAGLVTKVYFPREVLPLSAVLSNAVNFVFALIPLFVLILVFRVQVGPSLLFLPVILLVQLMFTAGLAFFFAALTVFYRDVGIIMETVILAWFFVTPIFYRIEDLSPTYSRLVYIVNPMASIISAYRDVLYKGGWPGADFLGRTFVTCLAVLVFGYVFFVHYSKRCAEEL